MALGVFICLFHLPPYDRQVAPALRRYANNADPTLVVNLLRHIIGRPQSARQDNGRQDYERQDYEHWIDSIAPDAGHKPSEQTLRELADMLIEQLCIPRMQRIDIFEPWLSERSEWFADLLDGGEELAGGRLEFTYGSGSLIATRQQIAQFLKEVQTSGEPTGFLAPEYDNLRKLLEEADSSPEYTLLKTSLK